MAVLGHDLALNAAARTVRLARLLEADPSIDASVDIVGARFGERVYAPFREAIRPGSVVPGRGYPGFLWTRRALARRLSSAEVIVAQKPRMASFGVALEVARRRRIPCILDIDDDEGALFDDAFPSGLAGAMRRWISLRNPNGGAWTARLARSVEDADAITAGSLSLARRYGATFVPFARDGRDFDPAAHDPGVAKRKLGVPDGFTIVFLGSYRPHKGLGDLALAVGGLAGHGVRLVVVGPLDESDRNRLTRSAGGALRVLPPVDEARIPETLAGADAVVIPQRDTPYARMQLPAKLLDAMAMGCPIVVTEVGDLPEVVGEAGLTVSPGPFGLTQGIRSLMCDPDLARTLGRAARERFLEHFDARVVGGRLVGLLLDKVARAAHR